MLPPTDELDAAAEAGVGGGPKCSKEKNRQVCF